MQPDTHRVHVKDVQEATPISNRTGSMPGPELQEESGEFMTQIKRRSCPVVTCKAAFSKRGQDAVNVCLALVELSLPKAKAAWTKAVFASPVGLASQDRCTTRGTGPEGGSMAVSIRMDCMKIALISDIHANWPALQACIAHARAQGVDQWAFLGDLVGYGAEPQPVLDCVMAFAQQGAWVLQGNHEAMALQPPPASDTSLAAATAQWTHEQLRPEHRDFIQALPLTLDKPPLLLVHASADVPQNWRYVDDPAAAGRCVEAALARGGSTHVMVGHVHTQALYYQGAGRSLMAFAPQPGVPVPVSVRRPLVACIGSCGQPRDRDPRAMYAMYDTAAARMVFQRVPYNHKEAAAAIRRAGLPELFAQRLEVGK